MLYRSAEAAQDAEHGTSDTMGNNNFGPVLTPSMYNSEMEWV